VPPAADAQGEVKRVPVLGFVAGFLDASGGGGWGPVATSTPGPRRPGAHHHRHGERGRVRGHPDGFSTVPAVDELHHLQIVAGLLIGGMMAARWPHC
jgi:hypothetical protein